MALRGLLLGYLLLIPTIAGAQAQQNDGSQPSEAVETQSQQSDSVGLHQNYLVPPPMDTGIVALDPDHAFGDQINLKNGGVEFDSTDISIPGNNGLPVTLSRQLVVKDLTHNPGDLLGFGDWSIAIPNLHGTFISSDGWQVDGTNPNLRCSHPAAPPELPDFASYQYWSGNWLSVPGAGEQALLMEPSSQIPAPPSGTYPWITKSFWRLSCESSTANGYPGEGFVAVSPEGVKYHFDYVVSTPTARIVRGWTPSSQGADYQLRDVVYFLVSRIEDRFGNWVDYQYSANHLQSITSNDGRYINLTWSGDRIVTATSSKGTWQYGYAGQSLATVTLPDGSSWSYSHTGDMKILPVNPPTMFHQTPTCTPPDIGSGTFAYYVTHPSGASARFDFGVARHGRSNVPKRCNNFPMPGGGAGGMVSYEWLTIPNFFDTLTLTSKQVSGPGLPTATWSYSYYSVSGFFADKCNIPNSGPFCPISTTTEVVGPGPTYQRYQFGAWYGVNEGQLLQVDTGTDASHILGTIATTYTDATSQPFPDAVGVNPLMYSDTLASSELRPQVKSVTTQDGATFTTTTNSFDVFARDTKQTESSSLGYSRVVQTSYYDNTSLWVLGQVSNSTIAGLVAAQTTFDTAKALPLKDYQFGKLVSTKAWNPDGTLQSVTDGNGRVTTLSSWYRGLPRTVTWPDGYTEKATVNSAGWITAITDENGYVTNYSYDAMGRLASITYPTADDVAWNQTLLSFTKVAASEYGIPAGHWKQVVHTGNGYAVTYFDAMWRPLVTERYDSGNKAATLSQVVQRYDAFGRTIFASYPANSITSYATASTGIDTSYDALGRPVSVQQDSELGTLTTTTTYQSGFETKVTDPLGHNTVTSYQAYGEPTTQFPDSVTAPGGQLTVIMRDAFGKPTSITRTGTAVGSPESDRYYVYDGYQQLCKRIDPESGASAFGYDNAGNVIWSAGGLNLPGTTTCDVSAAYGSGRRVDRSYDARNRLLTLNFPDGFGNQTWTYTPDGLPAQISTAGSGENVVNSYVYDKRRLLVHEDLAGRSIWTTWRIIYGYDANAHLTSQSLPIGTWTYAPDFAGRPTQLTLSGGGTYITGVQYALDGTVKQFTRANGIVRTITENARLLPSRIVDVGGGVTPIDQRYTWDKDANPTAITDYGNSAQNRTMTYDALDRLAGTNAASMGGQYNYSYDVLDNLRTLAHVGGSTSTYNYDSNNRLASIANTVNGTKNYVWDVQGNLVNSAGKVYQFSYGNRLVSIAATASYRYDGWGRRLDAYDTALQASLRSIYTRSGQLAFQQDYRGGPVPFHTFQYLGGQLAVVVDYDANRIPTARYPHTDAQGTIVAYTNSGRTILSRSVYDSWGGPRDHGNDDGPGYTGHFQDALTGLSYMQQRYYDPALARFISVDPEGVDGTAGGNFNRYWYANDNPYRYTDPDGRQVGEIPVVVAACAASPPCAGAVVVGVTAVAVAAKKAGDAGAKYYDHVMQSKQEKAKDGSSQADKGKGNSNPYSGPVDSPVTVVDSDGNAIPVNKGEQIGASPDGKYQQVKDHTGKPTGTRLDKGGHSGHADPKAQAPHAHSPGVTDATGNPHLPVQPPKPPKIHE